jgi:hypothetical protein
MRAGAIYVYQTDYTPTGGEKVLESITVRMIENGENYTVVVHEKKWPKDLGLTYDFYAVFSDKIGLLMSVNVLGHRKVHEDMPIILKLPGYQWTEETDDPEEYYRYRTSYVGDDNEIIEVQKDIYTHNKLWIIEYYYYKKNVGLVAYRTYNPETKKSSVPRELIYMSDGEE